MERLRVSGISWDGHWTRNEQGDLDEWVDHKGFREFIKVVRDRSVQCGRGGDEYGNPTLFFNCSLFGIIWWYPTGHYQTDMEMPDPGVNKWVDKVFYGGCEDGWCRHD